MPPGDLCLARRVTRDGRLFYTQQDPNVSRWPLLAVRLDTPGEAELLFEPEGRVRSMAPSADGTWLAYEAQAGDVREIHLRRLDGGGPWQLSLGGGSKPRWGADGRLYYRVNGGLTWLKVGKGERFEASSREALLVLDDDAVDYLPAGDDEALLVLRASSQRPRQLRLLLDWAAELERLPYGP